MIRNIRLLTGIRFFAAFHVVLYHNFYLLNFKEGEVPQWIENFISKGEAAVSFFFILSGFILSYVYADKLESKQQVKKFYFNRIAKLYPLYFLAFCLDIPRVIPFFLESEALRSALVKIGISSVAHLTMIQSWHPRLTPVWNAPGWSLSCEFFFYLCFPFLIRPLSRLRFKGVFYALLYTVPIMLYFMVTRYKPALEESSIFLTFWRSFPLLRICEFMMGILLYNWSKDPSPLIKRNRHAIFWLALGATFIIATMDINLPEKIYNGIVLAPLFSLVILCAYWDDIKGSIGLRNRLIEFLGLSSYALYILHQPLKNYLLFGPIGFFYGVIYFIGTIGVSILAYKYFETPVLNFLKRRSIRKS